MILFLILIGLTILILIWHYTTRSYINPYRLYMIFGKKGCGKSTLLTKLAYENLKKNRTVYSTEHIQFKMVDKKADEVFLLETKDIEPRYIYDYSFNPGDIILIDEVNLLWDNRDFKKMDPKIIHWFRLQRHYKVTVYLFSQTWDIDKKLRDLCDDMYICQKFLRVFTIARHIIRKPVIVHPEGDSPASIQDDIVEDGLLLAPFGGMKTAFIPHWAKYYDSFKLTDNLEIKG